MSLTFIVVNHKKPRITLNEEEVDKTMTVLGVKKIIAKILEIDVEKIIMLHSGRIVDDVKKYRDCKFEQTSNARIICPK